MEISRKVARAAVVLAMMPAVQGCLATKVVTVPVKVAYGAGKVVVKGTAAAVRAVVPDDDETPPAQDRDGQHRDSQDRERQEPSQQPPAAR